MTNLHVIFGAGQVGTGLARALRAAGHRVRVARRSAQPVGDGIELVTGDARDPAFAVEAAAGASVIYHCMNPSAYTAAAWQAEFPVLGEALIAAAIAADARLVCLDNLYPYGDVTERTESTPLAATGPKGKVRTAWDARLRSTPGLRFTMGRAGDFFGPGTGSQSLFSADMVAGLSKGKRPWLLGDVDATHAFSFVPDVVAGLAALGTAEADVEGHVFHLPIVQLSPRELVRQLSTAAGRQLEPRVIPGWGVRVLAPVVPLLRELLETFYQWEQPFRAEDAKFRTRFPDAATPYPAAFAACVPVS